MVGTVVSPPTGIPELEVDHVYACICRGVTVDEIVEHVRDGARSVNQVGRRCGAGTDCGRCVHKIKAIVLSTPVDDGTMELPIAG